MMRNHGLDVWSLLLMVLSVVLAARPLAGTESSDYWIAEAVKLHQQEPGCLNSVGLSEMYRAAGQDAKAMEVLNRASKIAGEEDLTRLLEYTCWRALTSLATDPGGFRARVDGLAKADNRNR